MEYEKRINFLTEEMKSEILKEVDRVINRELEGIEIDIFKANIIGDHLRKKYGADIEEVETNGWEGDVWYSYIINDIKFYLSASGYDGGVHFHISDEYLTDEDFEEYDERKDLYYEENEE